MLSPFVRQRDEGQLGAERIGLSMDESDQLEPEQSTTALVALHSKARYFSA